MQCNDNFCFSKIQLFKNLTTEEIQLVSRMFKKQTYPKGQLILHAGDNKKMLFIVCKGKVKVERLLEDGSEQILRFVNASDYFGETTLFIDGPLDFNVETMETTTIGMMDGEKLKQFLYEKPAILFKILEQFSIRMKNLEERLTVISHKEVDARVASYICNHMDKEKGQLTLEISKKDIAALLGTTRESISRKLSQFQKNNYICMEGSIIKVINSNALELIAMK